MSAAAEELRATGRAAVRARRRAGAARVWRAFCSHRSGLVGLVLLVVVVLLAVIAPLLVPAERLDVTKVTALPDSPPSGAHWLGTDPSGRDVLGVLLWGSRASLLVGFAATTVSMVIGTVVGMASGHFERITRAVLLRLIDFFLIVPSLVLAIVLSTVLARGLSTIVLAIGLTSWAATARVVRAQTLTIEARPYIERARALGAGDGRILARHVFPSVVPIVLANTTLTVGAAIIAESTLAFLGLGDPTRFSWGTMLKTAVDTGSVTAGYWWYVLSPGVAIVVVVLCFTLVGRALEAVLNPTLPGLT